MRFPQLVDPASAVRSWVTIVPEVQQALCVNVRGGVARPLDRGRAKILLIPGVKLSLRDEAFRFSIAYLQRMRWYSWLSVLLTAHHLVAVK